MGNFLAACASDDEPRRGSMAPRPPPANPFQVARGTLPWSVGSRVRLKGLLAKAELNGNVGTIVALVSASRRYTVRLDGNNGAFDLKEQNMTLLSDPNASAIGRGLPDNGDEWNPTHPVNVAKKWAAATETNDVESLLALAHPQIASHNDSNVVNGRLLLTGRAEVLHQREKHPPPYRPLKDWVNCTDDPSYLVQELAPSSGGQGAGHDSWADFLDQPEPKALVCCLSVGTLSGVLTASASRQQSAEAAVREARTRLAAALRNGRLEAIQGTESVLCPPKLREGPLSGVPFQPQLAPRHMASVCRHLLVAQTDASTSLSPPSLSLSLSAASNRRMLNQSSSTSASRLAERVRQSVLTPMAELLHVEEGTNTVRLWLQWRTGPDVPPLQTQQTPDAGGSAATARSRPPMYNPSGSLPLPSTWFHAQLSGKALQPPQLGKASSDAAASTAAYGFCGGIRSEAARTFASLLVDGTHTLATAALNNNTSNNSYGAGGLDAGVLSRSGHGPSPAALQVRCVVRIENAALWQTYCATRQALKSKRGGGVVAFQSNDNTGGVLPVRAGSAFAPGASKGGSAPWSEGLLPADALQELDRAGANEGYFFVGLPGGPGDAISLAAAGWGPLMARQKSSTNSRGGFGGDAFGAGLYLWEAASQADNRAGASDSTSLYCGPCAEGDAAYFGGHGLPGTAPPSLVVPLPPAGSYGGSRLTGELEWRTRGDSDVSSNRDSDLSDGDSFSAAGSSLASNSSFRGASASPTRDRSAKDSAAAASRPLRPPGMFESRAGSFALVLCRASLGCPLVCANSDPAAASKAASSGKHDSVVGSSGPGSSQKPRTFTVLDPSQAYPEYVVIYDRVYDWL